MRILYVSHTHPPDGSLLDNVGGMQRVSKQLIEKLKEKEGVTVVEKTTNVSGKKGKVGISTTLFLLKQLAVLPAKAAEFRADVILFSSMVTASLAYFIRNRVDIPMVTINHGRDVTLPVDIYQWFIPKVFDALDGVISVSRATREECIKRGMNEAKGVALPNGFDSGKLANFPDKEESRSVFINNFGIPLQDHPMLLTVGRQVKRKGHEWFIRNVLPKIECNVVYVMIGDGPEEERIQKAIADLECRNRIFTLGRQPDSVLNYAYAAADLFVMPNIPVKGDMEGFGIVLLEANMAKTPAVASDLEGIKDVIEEGENGYKIPPRQSEQFAEKIDDLLNGDLQKISAETKSYVKNRFSWQAVSDHYLNFLENVVTRYRNEKGIN